MYQSLPPLLLNNDSLIQDPTPTLIIKQFKLDPKHTVFFNISQ